MGEFRIVCGKWTSLKSRWSFDVDNTKGCKILTSKGISSFDELVDIVHEDFRFVKEEYATNLSYVIPKKILATLSADTPPVKIGNWRLCVQFNPKTPGRDVIKGLGKRKSEISGGLHEGETFEEEVDEVIEPCEGNEENDEGIRFDYIDDSNGASSEDENFAFYGQLSEEDELAEPARNGASRMQTTLTRGVEKLLEARLPYARQLVVHAIDVNNSEMSSGDFVHVVHVVNLREKKIYMQTF
ncbi:unnamed protein product [Cochlearia groenlandica]